MVYYPWSQTFVGEGTLLVFKSCCLVNLTFHLLCHSGFLLLPLTLRDLSSRTAISKPLKWTSHLYLCILYCVNEGLFLWALLGKGHMAGSSILHN